MSEDNYRISAGQRNWLQRLTKLSKYSLVISVLIPVVCCGVLLFRIYELNRELDDLTVQIEMLTQMSMEQQRWLENVAKGQLVIEQGAGTAEQDEVTKEQGEKATEPEVPATDNLTEESGQEPSEVQALHKVYLTFDDGPSRYTNEILGILERYQVKATFFVVGKENETAEEAMRAIVDGGHTIGLHSYSHKYSEIYQSVEDFAADFEQLQDYVYQVTGVKSTVYRFPGGSSNTISELDMREFADYLDTQGVEFYDWNISSGDGGSSQLDVQTLVANCTRSIEKHETSIILMHDSADKSTTVEALPAIIESILAMEDTVILPITEDTEPVHHIDMNAEE